MELSQKQINRQDFVDNKIHELLQELVPSDKQIEWDIEVIGAVRDTITKVLIDRELCSEQEFYPFIEE